MLSGKTGESGLEGMQQLPPTKPWSLALMADSMKMSAATGRHASAAKKPFFGENTRETTFLLSPMAFTKRPGLRSGQGQQEI